MADLSFAAQAMLAAYHEEAIDYIESWGSFSHKRGMAAALRAAADQVVPQPPKNWDLISPVAARECEIRKNLLAIATELDNANHTRGGLLDD
jgi:hypothetical protein